MLALAVHGYHPYSEDGGIYMAAAEHALSPRLFPHLPQFADAHVTCVFFSRIMAVISTLTHLPLTWIFFLAYTASIYLTLSALSTLLRLCMQQSTARWYALLLFTATITTPVAGTSIITIDPYLSSRSLSLPLLLLAIAESLRPHPRWLRMTMYLVFGALLHPLVAACGILLITLNYALQRGKRSWVIAISAFSLITATILHLLAPAETAAYYEAVLSRPYWFLLRWEWYEILGVIAPILLLLLFLRNRPAYVTPAFVTLIRSLCIGGGITLAVNLIFAHPDSGNHLVASLQSLRFFAFIYITLTLALGSLLARMHSRWPAMLFTGALAGLLCFVQRTTYPSTVHLELPGRKLTNDWERVFLWVSQHTPQDALFALDADYNDLPGEDTHLFRAIALRDALPDFSKDGGIAAVKPSIAEAWSNGVRLQHGLNLQDDATRVANLRPAGVTWIILPPAATTRLVCPYNLHGIRVCKLA